jgi:hypothetical protein
MATYKFKKRILATGTSANMASSVSLTASATSLANLVSLVKG